FQDYLTSEQVEDNMRNRIPLHGEGRPEDVAAALAALAENDFITGAEIPVDGGMTEASAGNESGKAIYEYCTPLAYFCWLVLLRGALCRELPLPARNQQRESAHSRRPEQRSILDDGWFP